MKSCSESSRIQSYLDGDLSGAEARRVESHARTCVTCASDIALYQRVFASLNALPLLDPGPHLTEKVMARVLPARIRQRWIRVLGWSYAAAFAVFLGGSILLVAQPGTQTALGRLSGEASGLLTGAMVMALQALGLAASLLAGGWGIMQSIGAWFAPLTRALSPLVGNSTVLFALGAAGIACTALLWSMKSREEADAERKVKHVAVLGF